MPTPARPAEPAAPLDDDQDTYGPSGTSDGPSDVRGLTPADDRAPDQPTARSGLPPPEAPGDMPPPVNDPDPNAPTEPLQDAGLAEDHDGVR